MDFKSNIPEGVPYKLIGANDYTPSQYKSEIRKRLGNTEVDLFNLIKTIISLYGIDIVQGEKANGCIVIFDKLNKYINESTLNKILRFVLDCDPKIAYALTSNKQLIEKFRFYYDTVKGYGVITIK
tara:strand:+ start:9544 stop:9921 length:378 start_codon:yes stop_codon:yes gene_type:complete